MGFNPSRFQFATSEVPEGDVPNRPVETVSWNAIHSFLVDTGLRLLTEAEWEHAYRAGTTTAFHSMPGYPAGTDDEVMIEIIAWCWMGACSNGAQCQTHPVGNKSANGFGLRDMSGNVFEWVNDRWGGYSAAPLVDPQGANDGAHRVVRGGS
jgi:formylglycine-generating enzyme required for sulfatase activity